MRTRVTYLDQENGDRKKIGADFFLVLRAHNAIGTNLWGKSISLFTEKLETKATFVWTMEEKLKSAGKTKEEVPKVPNAISLNQKRSE